MGGSNPPALIGPKMNKEEAVASDEFNFTWGLHLLDELGYVQLFVFMLRAYSQLGITRTEMLLLSHLASYHYNSPAGESRPSLTTVAREMGYRSRVSVSRLVSSLKEKGMLVVHERPGKPSIYDASPFARAALRKFLRLHKEEL